MSQLTVVARIKAKAGVQEKVHQELRKLIPLTLAESGCLNYDLHRSIDDPTLFLFYENWESRLLWEQHMAADHIKTFRENTEGLIEKLDIDLWTLEGNLG
ncbi:MULTISPECIES: putative quinol monooxygenase [Arthrospira]|uniref:ABM domain-containing protein n=1 Tax=Limnospira platensis NIES-46 TaxID=1236695 RepID=A0A5M3T458_LIMPL|nr:MULTISPECIES: putative quinol monooxygenase [Arthrospira]AMW28195.1 antibiotic biosynthesis monooxygenase [Arthrospira platensis YZ]KDR56815.1 antibiotic biosynthesis monooxygenase [Arthrospira platensis str. Paraca]MBD2668396.1 antibiotic biosynthesis monooxygenase [Arthrospira platensis FACHB-439]MBD2711455.1 antibiotic biosynthesis monooxygenase [Arthrospira platensis FACHB-835]MDF2209336.1 putative quinol monooxygenase [Arthrospira platensis NCB002]MDT9182000.1 putative quinol monooxyg